MNSENDFISKQHNSQLRHFKNELISFVAEMAYVHKAKLNYFMKLLVAINISVKVVTRNFE